MADKEIRIYLANLAAYNRGMLVGKWFDLPNDVPEMVKEVMTLPGSAPGDEEWAIHDYEAPFEIEEYDNLDDLNELAERLESLDEDYDLPRVLFLVNTIGMEWSEALDSYEDVTFYPDMTLEDLVYEFLEEGIYSPESLEYYIDYEAIGRDLQMDGYYEDDDGNIRDWEDQDTGFTSFEELAQSYVIDVSGKPNYLDIKFMAKELRYDYVEEDDGVFRYD